MKIKKALVIFARRDWVAKWGEKPDCRHPEMSGHWEDAGQTQRQHTWNLKGATHTQKWEHSRKATDVNKTAFLFLNLGETAFFNASIPIME